MHTWASLGLFMWVYDRSWFMNQSIFESDLFNESFNQVYKTALTNLFTNLTDPVLKFNLMKDYQWITFKIVFFFFFVQSWMVSENLEYSHMGHFYKAFVCFLNLESFGLIHCNWMEKSTTCLHNSSFHNFSFCVPQKNKCVI